MSGRLFARATRLRKIKEKRAAERGSIQCIQYSVNEEAGREINVVQQVEDQEEHEPSLLVTKGLLFFLISSIANITKFKEALRKEVSDVKAWLELIDQERKDVKSLCSTLKLNVAKKILRHETKCLEYYTRNNLLEIHGILKKTVTGHARCCFQSRLSSEHLHRTQQR